MKVLDPGQFRYRFLRMLMAEGIIEEPHCLAAVVDSVASAYEMDWARCVNSCYDLERDEEQIRSELTSKEARCRLTSSPEYV